MEFLLIILMSSFAWGDSTGLDYMYVRTKGFKKLGVTMKKCMSGIEPTKCAEDGCNNRVEAFLSLRCRYIFKSALKFDIIMEFKILESPSKITRRDQKLYKFNKMNNSKKPTYRRPDKQNLFIAKRDRKSVV